MKLQGEFLEIFDVMFVEGETKPNRRPYLLVQEEIYKRHGENVTIFFADDWMANLAQAKTCGWKTIHIGPPAQNYNTDSDWSFPFLEEVPLDIFRP